MLGCTSVFSTVGPDLLCRGAFGLGAIVVAALLAWAVVRALRAQADEQSRASTSD